MHGNSVRHECNKGEAPARVLTRWGPCVDCSAREPSRVLALNDTQLQIVMTAAGSLPVGKRGVFLERVAVRPQLRGPHFTDADLGERTCVPTEKLPFVMASLNAKCNFADQTLGAPIKAHFPFLLTNHLFNNASAKTSARRCPHRGAAHFRPAQI